MTPSVEAVRPSIARPGLKRVSYATGVDPGYVAVGLERLALSWIEAGAEKLVNAPTRNSDGRFP